MFDLKLTTEEAVVLHQILANIGGHPETTMRAQVDTMFAKVYELVERDNNWCRKWDFVHDGKVKIFELDDSPYLVEMPQELKAWVEEINARV